MTCDISHPGKFFPLLVSNGDVVRGICMEEQPLRLRLCFRTPCLPKILDLFMHCRSEGGWATYLRYRLTNSVNLEGITHTAHSALAGESGNESDSSPVPLLQLIPAVKPTSKTFPPAASDRLLPFVMLLLPARIQCRPVLFFPRRQCFVLYSTAADNDCIKRGGI